MCHWNSEDPELVSFLQKYRPNIPPASDDLEQQLMLKIQQQPQTNHTNHKALFWIIPSAIAAIILLIWGGFRLTHPSTQWANKTENTEELEAFVMDTWYEVTTASEVSNTPEEDLILLMESD